MSLSLSFSPRQRARTIAPAQRGAPTVKLANARAALRHVAAESRVSVINSNRKNGKAQSPVISYETARKASEFI